MPPAARIENHPLWTTLQSLKASLDGAPPQFDADQSESMVRARTTVNEVWNRLEECDNGFLVSDTALDNGHAWTSVMLNELQSAISVSNPAAVGNGTNYFNNLEALQQNIHTFPRVHSTAALSEAERRLAEMQALQHEHEGTARIAKDQIQQTIAQTIDLKSAGQKRIEQQEKAINDLLASLGGRATASNFAATADRERKEANTWRIVTIAVGVAVVVLAAWLIGSKDGDHDAESIITRLSSTLPGILLAVYAGRQAAGHREQEREATRLEMAFGTVDSYLADLEPTARADLKKDISGRLYTSGPGGGPAGDYTTTADLLGLLIQAIRRLGS